MSTVVGVIIEAETRSALEARNRTDNKRGGGGSVGGNGGRAGIDAGTRDGSGGATTVRGVGAPFTNNDPGRPDVHVVGRARAVKPIRSVKSQIVPEPDQIQSAPSVRPTRPELG
jgi:hypothetical protein